MAPLALDLQIFYLANAYPLLRSHWDFKILRRTSWRVENRDGSEGRFTSWWFFNHLQWYHGSGKCDGSQSYRARACIMTDVPKELRAFRWRAGGPNTVGWDNLGGS